MTDNDSPPAEEQPESAAASVAEEQPEGDAAVTQEAASAEAAAATQEVAERRAMRRKTVRFVVVFVVSVFVLLAGYEYARETRLNDWYLFQVARSANFLLSYLGESSSVGGGGGSTGKETEIRAKLREWGAWGIMTGAAAAPADARNPAEAQEPPLTAWEAWQYQAEEYRLELVDAKRRVREAEALPSPEREEKLEQAQQELAQVLMADKGPLVMFVFKQSPLRALAEAKNRLALAKSDKTLTDEQRACQVTSAQADVWRLEGEIKPLQADPEKNKGKLRGYYFNFTVISECGGIQPMAIFIAAILAFPALWWRRLAGIIVGIPLLFWINAFRLAFLAVVGALDNAGAVFKFTHEYLWQGIYIVFVVAIWVGWVELLVRRRA